ncbi:hypothetical protein F5Y19DRAFT_448909 [Xylariaceae sp. FL1651]|nr:hypothetical protein F5Y19DRAFT_448909 [Xylariaceae sp. FL1651]
MCRIIAAICPRTALGGIVSHELRSFLSTHAWFCQDMLRFHQYFLSGWIDTVFLAVTNSSRDETVGAVIEGVLRSGFIARVGSNCQDGLRALTVSRMKPDQIDFRVVRSWIDCCIDTYFSKRCKPKLKASILPLISSSSTV